MQFPRVGIVGARSRRRAVAAARSSPAQAPSSARNPAHKLALALGTRAGPVDSTTAGSTRARGAPPLLPRLIAPAQRLTPSRSARSLEDSFYWSNAIRYLSIINYEHKRSTRAGPALGGARRPRVLLRRHLQGSRCVHLLVLSLLGEPQADLEAFRPQTQRRPCARSPSPLATSSSRPGAPSSTTRATS